MQTIITDAHLIPTVIPHCLSVDCLKVVKKKKIQMFLTLKCIHVHPDPETGGSLRSHSVHNPAPGKDTQKVSMTFPGKGSY